MKTVSVDGNKAKLAIWVCDLNFITFIVLKPELIVKGSFSFILLLLNQIYFIDT